MKISTPKYNWQSYKFGTISLCMIMKDEAKHLPRCLRSVAGLVDETIIVDTGSRDDSVKIAESYGARVLHDPWQDDFARPRNIGIEKARGQWILVIDPDEMISREHHIDIKWLTRAEKIVAFWLTTQNYGPYCHQPNFHFITGGKDPMGLYPGFIPSTKTRFFKNGLGIRFEGCWHELVDWYLFRKKLPTAQAQIPIHHWVHEILQATPVEKKTFYLKLGEKKVREWPKHGQARWELAVAEELNGLRGRASHSLAEAFRLGFGGKDQYWALGRIQRSLNQKEKSDFAFEKGVCVLYPALTHIDADKKPLAALVDGL